MIIDKKKIRRKWKEHRTFLLCISAMIFLISMICTDTIGVLSFAAENQETSDENSPGEDSEQPTTEEYKVTTEYPDIPGKAPDLVSNAAVILDAETGNILYQKNADDKHYPASITKLMTCLLAIENSSLSETVTMSYDAIWGIERDSSHIALNVDESLSMEDCLYALMLESANEVAWGIGEHLANGSIEAFAEMMNERADKLGLKNTHFVNANGLHDDNHYTSCYDMALIAKECLKYKEFRTITGTMNHTIAPTNLCDEERPLWQHCKLINSASDYYYEYCEGGKPGYTDAALNTLVSWSKKNDIELICVVMDCNGAYNTYTDTIALCNYCFENFSYCNPLTDYTFSDKDISQINEYLNNYYDATSKEAISVEVDKDYKLNFSKHEDISKITYSIEYYDEPVANKKQHTYIIGNLVLSYQGDFIGKTEISVKNYNPVKNSGSSDFAGASTGHKSTDAFSDSTGNAKNSYSAVIIGIIIFIFIVICFISYIIYVDRTRKKKQAKSLARAKALEQKRKQMMDEFDKELEQYMSPAANLSSIDLNVIDDIPLKEKE